jgi:hypothetical protein
VTHIVAGRRRSPTVGESRQLYLACLVPIMCWSVLYTLHDGLPVWVRQMTLWDVVGTVAYLQTFVLIETASVVLVLLLACLVLPSTWLRDKFVPVSTAVVYLSAVWAVWGQRHDSALRAWSFGRLAPYLSAYWLTVVGMAVLMHRSARLQRAVQALVERASVLGTAYLFVGAAAVVVVLARVI